MSAPIEWIDEPAQVLGVVGQVGVGALPTLSVDSTYIFSIRFSTGCGAQEAQFRQQLSTFGFKNVKSWVPPYDILSAAGHPPAWVRVVQFALQSNSDPGSCVVWFKGKWRGGSRTTFGAEGYGTSGVVESVWTEQGSQLYAATTTQPGGASKSGTKKQNWWESGGGGAPTPTPVTTTPAGGATAPGATLFPQTLPGTAPTTAVRVVVATKQDAAPSEVIFDGSMRTAQAQTAFQNLQQQPAGRWAIKFSMGGQTLNKKVSEQAMENIRLLFGAAPLPTPAADPLAVATDLIGQAQARCPTKSNELWALRAQYITTMNASSVQAADAELQAAIDALCPAGGAPGGGGGGGGAQPGGGGGGGAQPGAGAQVPPYIDDLINDAKQRCPGKAGAITPLRAFYASEAQNVGPQSAEQQLRDALETQCPTGQQQAEAQLGFPIPDMTGIPSGVALQAIEAVQKAVAECPGLAGPNGPVAHALAAFAIFGTAAAQAGTGVQPHLDVLFETLDQLCPTWRGGQPGVPNPSPPAPPATRDPVSDLLANLVLFLSQQDVDKLADLAAQAAQQGLPRLSAAVQQYLDTLAKQPGDTTPGGTTPGDTTPGGGGPDGGVPVPPGGTTTKKKKSNTGLIVGVIVVGVAAAIVIKAM